MEPLVSIIVPQIEEDLYFVRCINSISRQNYKNIEIIVIGNPKSFKNAIINNSVRFLEGIYENEYRKINDAIKHAKGEYILFCNVTTLLSPNLLCKLIENAKGILGVVKVSKIEQNQIIKKASDEVSLTGKLYDKSILTDNHIEIDENEFCPEYHFVMQYKEHCSSVRYCEEGYWYEDADEIKFNRQFNILGVKRCILNLKNSSLSQESIEYFILSLFDFIKLYNLCEVVDIATDVIKEFETLPDLNCKIAEQFLKEIYEKCLNEDNCFEWKMFQKYFSSIGNEQLLDVILSIFGLEKIHLNLLTKYSISEFKFYKERLQKEKQIFSDDRNKELLDAIQALSKKMDVQKTMQKTNVKEQVIYQIQNLQGIELGEYVIKECKEGRLGLKYVIKSLIACILYKFGK